MWKRSKSLVLAALLLMSAGVAFATTVQSQAFEEQATIEEAGSASLVQWADQEPGKLRLELAPTEDAVAPAATVSLYDGAREHQGTFELTEDWPQLDRLVQAESAMTIVVHEATDATVSILSEEDRDVTVEPAKMDRTTVRLVDGEHEDLAYQISVDQDDRLAHMGLTFEGSVSDLNVEVTNQEDETVLMGAVPQLVTEDGEAISAELSPADFAQGSLLVRAEAATFNGTLAMELVSFTKEQRYTFTLDHHGEEDEASQEEEETNESEEAQANSSATWHAPVDGVTVAELDEDAPLAFNVPAGVDSVILYGHEDCVEATIFDGQDQIVARPVLSEEEGAQTWNEEEHQVYIEVPLEGDGEHVIVLTQASGEAFLFVPGIEDAEAVDHRELEIEETTVELESDEEDQGMFLDLGGQEANATATLTSGLVGFSWAVHDGISADQEVQVYDPEGELAYESHAFGSGLMHATPWSSAQSLLGAPGDWVIETESSGPTSHTIEATFFTYVR